MVQNKRSLFLKRSIAHGVHDHVILLVRRLPMENEFLDMAPSLFEIHEDQHSKHHQNAVKQLLMTQFDQLFDSSCYKKVAFNDNIIKCHESVIGSFARLL